MHGLHLMDMLGLGIGVGMIALAIGIYNAADVLADAIRYAADKKQE